MNSTRTQEEEILTWCGVIAQLSRTRAKKIIADATLPYPLFILLRHFCHDPERKWTISALTAAFETGQSGMTKRVQKLIDLGYLATEHDEQDARIKWIRVTAAGRALRDQLLHTLAPDQASIFSSWSKSDVTALHQHLFRLKTYLDDHRDSIVTGN
ncbi:MAG: MarR family winged helix-turn-helix transcriptional regulator [bacterium]